MPDTSSTTLSLDEGRPSLSPLPPSAYLFVVLQADQPLAASIFGALDGRTSSGGRTSSPPRPVRESDVPPEAWTPEDLARREELVALFEAHGGNVSAVARATGKARMQIQRWMRRYEIGKE